MRIVQIDSADIDLVEVKTTNECKPTPHCKVHGAMNKTTVHEDGGGYWRCISSVSVTKVVKGNSIGYVENDNTCRAGCCEVRDSELEKAIRNPIWKDHKSGDDYTMDGKPDLWKIAYYPIFEDGKTGQLYNEPRALIEKPIKGGTDFREVPLRYLNKKASTLSGGSRRRDNNG